MRGWLLANLFIVVLVLIGAGFTFLAAWIYQSIDPNGFMVLPALTLVALALLGTYYVGLLLYKWVGRFVNRGVRRR